MLLRPAAALESRDLRAADIDYRVVDVSQNNTEGSIFTPGASYGTGLSLSLSGFFGAGTFYVFIVSSLLGTAVARAAGR